MSGSPKNKKNNSSLLGRLRKGSSRAANAVSWTAARARNLGRGVMGAAGWTRNRAMNAYALGARGVGAVRDAVDWTAARGRNGYALGQRAYAIGQRALNIGRRGLGAARSLRNRAAPHVRTAYSCTMRVCRRVKHEGEAVARLAGAGGEDLTDGLHATEADKQKIRGIVFRLGMGARVAAPAAAVNARAAGAEDFAALTQRFHGDLGNVLDAFIGDNDLEADNVAAFREAVRVPQIASKLKRLYMTHLAQMGRLGELEGPNMPTAIAMAMHVALADFDDMEYDDTQEGDLAGVLARLVGEGAGQEHFAPAEGVPAAALRRRAGSRRNRSRSSSASSRGSRRSRSRSRSRG